MKIIDREKKYLDFKKKYLWKKCDSDWAYWYQCVDLSKIYAKEVYWENLGSFWWSAYNGYLNEHKTFNITKWKKVEYKPWTIFIAWDIFFYWPTPSNKYWHTWIIAVGGTIDKCILLEQNYVSERSPDFGKGVNNASITQRSRDYKWIVWVWRLI